MKFEEIKSLPNKELVERYREERKLLQKMKFQNAVSQIDHPHMLKETRKNIARMLTELNSRRSDSEYQAYLKTTSEEN
jgi:large subunit ribosomal protein L29